MAPSPVRQQTNQSAQRCTTGAMLKSVDTAHVQPTRNIPRGLPYFLSLVNLEGEGERHDCCIVLYTPLTCKCLDSVSVPQVMVRQMHHVLENPTVWHPGTMGFPGTMPIHFQVLFDRGAPISTPLHFVSEL